MRWTTLSLSLVLAATGVARAETPEAEVRGLVDYYRATVGLPPVILDRALSNGCSEHAEYMRLNAGTDAMVGLNAHTQRPDLPGASKAGAACGKAADLFPGVSDLGSAVDAWMAGIYHRRPILDPGLARIGVGYSKLPDGSLMAALMFVDGDARAAAWPVAYPAKDQRAVPLEYGNEVPNPIPGGGHGGYPITLQFPPFDKVTGVRAVLTDATGTRLPIYLSDPEHPATSFGQYGVVSVIPRQRLRPDTRYTVRIEATWNGKRLVRSWAFTTLGLQPVFADDAAAMTAAIGIASKVRGKVVNTGMIDAQTVFLALTDDAGGRKLVSVVVPLAVWKRTHGGQPASVRGAHVQVEATPQLVQDRFINLPISSADQLLVLPARRAAARAR